MTAANLITAVQRELEQYPGVQMETHNRGKHQRLLFTSGERSRFLTIPRTPSDWRASQNAIRDFRKTMKELGAARLGGEMKVAKSEKVAIFSLSPRQLTLHFGANSKLINRFRTEDGKPTAHWSIELRSSFDLTAPPLIALKRAELPPGVKKVGVAAGFDPGSGGWRITMGRGLFPALKKTVDEISSTKVRLYQDNGDEIVLQLPPGTIPTGFRKREPEPGLDLRTIDSPPEPSEELNGFAKVEAPETAEAPQVDPTTGLKDQPITLQFPKQTVSVEAAIGILNKAKRRLGSNLRFTIEEGGFLSAVHRIGK